MQMITVQTEELQISICERDGPSVVVKTHASHTKDLGSNAIP